MSGLKSVIGTARLRSDVRGGASGVTEPLTGRHFIANWIICYEVCHEPRRMRKHHDSTLEVVSLKQKYMHMFHKDFRY